MGIKSNYIKCIRQICGNEIFKPTHVSEFAYKKIAIDTTLYLFKYKAAMADRWICGILNIIKILRQNNVHPVFIFDGKAPDEKKQEQKNRQDDKHKLQQNVEQLQSDMLEYYNDGKISDNLKKLSPGDNFNPVEVQEKIHKKKNQVIKVNGDDFRLLKDLFTVCSIPYYTAPSEAEKFCAKLCIDGHVSAVLSDDTDVIAYNCPTTLCRILSSSGGCFSVSNSELLEKMKFTKQQLLDHCIMCGTDYNKNIPKVGSMTSYKHIADNGSIENVSKNTQLDVSCLNHHAVRKLFTEFETYEISIPYCEEINTVELERFFYEHNIPVNFNYFMTGIYKPNLEFI